MASPVKEQPPKFEYDYIIIYHPYTLKKPKEIEVSKEELAEKVAEFMDDGKIQYVTVIRNRKGAPRGSKKIWVGG